MLFVMLRGYGLLIVLIAVWSVFSDIVAYSVHVTIPFCTLTSGYLVWVVGCAGGMLSSMSYLLYTPGGVLMHVSFAFGLYDRIV
jgi:hypothetical protein